MRMIQLSDVSPEPVEWLWRGYIPHGKVTVIEGDPEVGKSLLTLDLAARCSSGQALPDGTTCSLGSVVLLDAEDGLRDTIIPRLDAAGADRSRIYLLNGGSGGLPPALPEDIPRIEAEIRATGAKLLVISPLNAFISERVDGHRDQHVRRALAPLTQVAERTGIAVLVVLHLNKRSGGNPIYRGMGSIGIAALARCVFVVGPDPNDSGGRVLACLKSNLGPRPPSLAFRIEGAPNGSARLVWNGESDWSGPALLEQWEPESERAREAAARFLRGILKEGSAAVDEVKSRAREAGVSERTLERAKAALGIKAERRGFGPGGQWYWALPGSIDRQAELAAYDVGPLPESWHKCAVHGLGEHWQRASGEWVCPKCEAAERPAAS